MPEKNGWTCTDGEVCVAVPLVIVVVVTFVTKKLSVPTLSTALVLFKVATRGLESTCTEPCVSRNCRRAAKLDVCSARPKTAPAGLADASAPTPRVTMDRAVESRFTPPLDRTWPRVPKVVDCPVLLETSPTAAPPRSNNAQLIPDWYEFES